MIQKRYEFIGRTGVTWTNWFDYCEDDRALSRFQEEEKFQLGCSRLRNEFRGV